MFNNIKFTAAAAALGALMAPAASAEEFITIGTGGVTGDAGAGGAEATSPGSGC